MNFNKLPQVILTNTTFFRFLVKWQGKKDFSITLSLNIGSTTFTRVWLLQSEMLGKLAGKASLLSPRLDVPVFSLYILNVVLGQLADWMGDWQEALSERKLNHLWGMRWPK